MNQFYMSIILLGMALVVTTFVWIIYDKKKSLDYVKKVDEKREELINIISDSEQMIDELNKFSDYIVNQVDLKKEELCLCLQNISQQVEQVKAKTDKSETGQPVPIEKAAIESAEDICGDGAEILPSKKSDLIIENMELREEAAARVKRYRLHTGAKVKVVPAEKKIIAAEKIIPINSKYKDVIRLANEGLSDTSIAKQLDMGKGEVQLILGINR
ncbi:MAG: hypothetical protein QHH06_00905 [Clostridiales bacterium]|jgi:hypothetical protein|nr:hypothetical protein [Eubacteriales bacterium]MDH7565030.1 hypothetical protein [Clostridiales bacterium]